MLRQTENSDLLVVVSGCNGFVRCRVPSWELVAGSKALGSAHMVKLTLANSFIVNKLKGFWLCIELNKPLMIELCIVPNVASVSI